MIFALQCCLNDTWCRCMSIFNTHCQAVFQKLDVMVNLVKLDVDTYRLIHKASNGTGYAPPLGSHSLYEAITIGYCFCIYSTAGLTYIGVFRVSLCTWQICVGSCQCVIEDLLVCGWLWNLAMSGVVSIGCRKETSHSYWMWKFSCDGCSWFKVRRVMYKHWTVIVMIEWHTISTMSEEYLCKARICTSTAKPSCEQLQVR